MGNGITELTLELFLGIFLPVFFAVAGIGYVLLYKTSSDVSEMSGTLTMFMRFYGGLGQNPPASIPNALKSPESEGSNPYDPGRKNELLDKWKQGLISVDEAEKLIGYLQEDAQGAAGAVLAAILLAIGLLGALIYVLTAGK